MPPAHKATGQADLSVPDLVGLLASKEPHAVLDVRERGEYILGHIAGSTNLPRGQLELRLPTIIRKRDVPIVFYCDDGHRSSLARSTAADLGYTDVRTLAGGLATWKAEGQEVAYGVNVIGKDYGERLAVQRRIPQITPDQLEELRQDRNVLLLDVRDPAEYEAEGHIAGAHNVPGGELTTTVLSQLLGDAPPETVVVNCAGRTRSIVGTDLLISFELGNVQALENGTMAWLMSGRELEQGPDPRPLPAPTAAARERAASLASRAADAEGLGHIDVEPLLSRIDEGDLLYVLDVRTRPEFEKERIAGAVSCPAGQLTNYLDDTVPVRQALVVCYSDDDTRSKFAVRTLRGIGYPHAVWLRGGLNEWRRAGALTTHGRNAERAGDAESRASAGDRVGLISVEEMFSPDSAVRPRRIVDVRRSCDYITGHIPHAVWVPRGDLERRVGRHVVAMDDVVVVSDDQEHAVLAASTLRAIGYSRVRVLEGGVTAWATGGHPLAEGSDGADINLLQAREEADLVGHGPEELRRTHADMVRYLHWEERLGDKYRSGGPPSQG
ncbi:rhodanese-like domain-containing protein [Streptomyces sp. NPDC052043]|uniref:rhodanese-like domain-containing protein n=1 Tax=Streptomyces sp. NPDC052043 TaxID=3365684 RepID=UPI0037D0DD83